MCQPITFYWQNCLSAENCPEWKCAFTHYSRMKWIGNSWRQQTWPIWLNSWCHEYNGYSIKFTALFYHFHIHFSHSSIAHCWDSKRFHCLLNLPVSRRSIWGIAKCTFVIQNLNALICANLNMCLVISCSLKTTNNILIFHRR